MKNALSVLAALAFLCVASNAQASLYDETIQPSVRVADSCSGQIVYSSRDQESGKVKTIILTAKHCVAGNKAGAVMEVDMPLYSKGNKLVGEKTVFATVLARDGKDDLALLILNDEDTLYPTLVMVEDEDARLELGEDCWAVGYPNGWSIMVSKGLLGPLERQSIGGQPEREYQRATAQIAPGSSGGGLYRLSDGKYKLIGIATARSRADGFIGIFTPITAVAPFLDKWLP